MNEAKKLPRARTTRSMRATAQVAFGKTGGQSLKARLVVRTMLLFSSGG
jgi:hypothetical protein